MVEFQNKICGNRGVGGGGPRSPASKMAMLARMAKPAKPAVNKTQWGTLLDAVKAAKVTKMLSKSKSDESIASKTERDQEQEPLQNVEKATEGDTQEEVPDLENRIAVPGILRSGARTGGLSLDPAALAARQLTERLRTKRPPKSSVSFDENPAPGSLENNESSTDPLVQQSEGNTGTCSSSYGSRSVSPSLAISESCEPLMTEHSRVCAPSNLMKTSNRLSPSASEPPSDIRTIGQPANGSLQASRIPGIQPINRQMSAGWL